MQMTALSRLIPPVGSRATQVPMLANIRSGFEAHDGRSNKDKQNRPHPARTVLPHCHPETGGDNTAPNFDKAHCFHILPLTSYMKSQGNSKSRIMFGSCVLPGAIV